MIILGILISLLLEQNRQNSIDDFSLEERAKHYDRINMHFEDAFTIYEASFHVGGDKPSRGRALSEDERPIKPGGITGHGDQWPGETTSKSLPDAPVRPDPHPYPLALT